MPTARWNHYESGEPLVHTSDWGDGDAVAYTMDHVNCQVDGSTVFTADPQETSGKYIDYVLYFSDLMQRNLQGLVVYLW